MTPGTAAPVDVARSRNAARRGCFHPLRDGGLRSAGVSSSVAIGFGPDGAGRGFGGLAFGLGQRRTSATLSCSPSASSWNIEPTGARRIQICRGDGSHLSPNSPKPPTLLPLVRPTFDVHGPSPPRSTGQSRGHGREASRRLSRSRFPRGPGPSDHGRLRSRGAAGAPMLGALVARRVAGAPMLAALAGRELAVPRGRCGVWRSRGLGPSECDCNSGSEGPRPLVDDVRLGSRGAWAPRDRSG
jgi:hypothetical protein